MPDLYLSNSRAAKYHDVLVPNFSLFVARDGTVAYSCRLARFEEFVFRLDIFAPLFRVTITGKWRRQLQCRTKVFGILHL